MYDFDKLVEAIRGIRENKKQLMRVYKEESEKEKDHIDHLREAANVLEAHGEVDKVLSAFDQLGIDRYDLETSDT